MIMKRTFIYLALAASVFCACQKENVGPADATAAEAPEFYAVMEGGKEDTKIHLGEYEGKYRVLWDGYNDLVAMCAGIDASSKYRVKGATANTPAAQLYAEKDTDVATEGNSIPDNVAYYPYPNSAKVGDVKVTRNEDGSYTVPGAFSDAQTYLAGSIPSRAFPIVAVSNGLDDNSLNFKNVAGGICFNVKGGAHVKQISFKSNEADKVIAGSADITVSNTDVEGSAPSYEFTGESKSITLNPAAAVVTDIDEATPFYMGVAPQTFPQGFSLTINDADGFSRTITTEKPREVRRSEILDMPAITFPFYEADMDAAFTYGSDPDNPDATNRTEFDSETKTFSFYGSSNRWFDLPGLKGDISSNPVLRMWVNSSNVVMRINVRHKIGDATSTTQTTAATLYGQTNKLITGRTKIEIDLSAQNDITEDMLENVVSVRVSMASAATGAEEPYHIELDRIVLE